MAAFFGNLRNVVIAGFVLAAGVAAIYVGCLHGTIDTNFWAFVTRWLHVAAGVMWIGLLWYFNFVQVPTMPKVPAELKGGVTGYIAPAALFYFRWAALVTIVLGIGLASQSAAYTLGDAFTLGLLGEPNKAASLIGLGMYLGLIMGFNVWFIIWPNQQKVLNIGGKGEGLSAEAKAAAGKTAMIASRFNTMASIPMLFCMVGAMHTS
ncbi:MAG: urate hydroxylase PuuD [Alphaproteobacteria bacterium]|nr:urate hydroxylase PuuD [Alphaproteobacteria bacterium]